MKRNIALFITYLLQPLVVPIYLLFLLFQSDFWRYVVSFKTKAYCMGTALIAFIVLPVLLAPLMKKLGLISFPFNNRSERIFAALGLFFTTLAGWFLSVNFIPPTEDIRTIYFTMLCIFLVYGIISVHSRMCIHMTTIGMACALPLVWQQYWIYTLNFSFRPGFIVALFSAAVLCSALIYLKKYTFFQIITSFIFGFTYVIIIYVISSI